MSSFTVSLSGNTSELTATFFPEIVLDERFNYSCGLLDFSTYHSIPNITAGANKITYKPRNVNQSGLIEIPEGCYEVEDILLCMQLEFQRIEETFDFIINKNTLKTWIRCTREIIGCCELNKKSLIEVLGFERDQLIEADKWIESKNVVKISDINVIRVECNIVTGSYVDGRLSHSIYEFPCGKVDIGYKLVEQPVNIIYLPVVPKQINCIQIKFVDQNGNLINFRGETITCRIHIKRDAI